MNDKCIIFQVKVSENFKRNFKDYVIEKGYGERGMSECIRDLIRDAIRVHELSKLSKEEFKC